MSDQMQSLLKQYTNGICNIFGSALKEVILYGSYARGNHNANSDVDIMILVEHSEQEIQKRREAVSFYTYDFNMNHDILIMPIVKNVRHFDSWLSVHPFYQNIQNEGVELYVS